ncbi:MAG: hypothetical protein WBW62_12030, partial [Solirubrobacterales bacterium]
LLMTEFRFLGGELAEPTGKVGALPRMDGEYMFMAMALPDGDAQVKYAADVISDYGRGRSCLNFGLEPIDRKTAFDAATLARLGELYRRLDPEGVLVQPHPMA